MIKTMMQNKALQDFFIYKRLKLFVITGCTLQKLSVSLTNPATSSPTGFVNADENGNIKTGKEAGESRSGYRQARTWGGKGQGWPISGDTGILCDCARH